MILGTFINGYKSYKKSYYIPIARKLDDKYSTYIGNNGVGKSAIFEALDVFFNERDWNINKGATKNDIYISPVFLINKSEFKEKITNKKYYNESDIENNLKIIQDINNISNYIFNYLDVSIQGATRREHINKFFDMLKNLNEPKIKEEYYVILLGIDVNRKPTFRPIEKYILSDVFNGNKDRMYDFLHEIKEILLQYYAYLYIPVEQNVDDILKVEATQMQILMDKNVLEEIDKALDTKFEINGKNKTILRFLNEHLNTFMTNVNKSIQTINNNYSYNSQAFTKKNLTASDIRDKILEAYFKKRTLKYNNREINALSSGEQRRALIDIAYAFLSNNEQKDKKVILAIDEPEVSLNVANCFSQFERLEELANKYKNQVLITTHWYGFLPIIKEGKLYHLGHDDNEKFELKEFSFFNYLTESRIFPDNVELKSMFDLSTSILSYIRSNKESKWIICEGSSDRIYLESILGKDEYKILPIGGCRLVANLYNLLVSPINMENKDGKNRVLCLVDTDEIKTNFDGCIPKKSSIQIRRLQVSMRNRKSSIELVNPFSDGQWYEKTEIEDCLNPRLYYNAISRVINSEEDSSIKSIFERFEYDEQAELSRIEGDYSILKPLDVDVYKEKYKIAEFLSDRRIKFKVAEEYSKLHEEDPQLKSDLVDVISEIFNN
ncbi:ATP-dependent nuclease [Clostridium perfringens]